jgi:hypothetical protein
MNVRVAAGTTGRELLFQASSEQMIQAYAQVPRFAYFFRTPPDLC